MSIGYFPPQPARATLRYDDPLEEAITRLSGALTEVPALAQYPARWLAIQLLEGDAGLRATVQATTGSEDVLRILTEQSERLRAQYGDDLDIVLTDQRYRFVHQITQRVLTRPHAPARTLSDKIDRIVTHKWLGIPIFMALMWVVFKITADLSAPMLDWVDSVIGGPLTNWVIAIISAVGLSGTWVESLAVDGIIAGVGGVLVFVPVLLSLYFALAILEDSGYMARAAFVMDRLMRALGLHGKSFLPMIVGFGCTVPAIYATRTLESKNDRILTGLLVPFMSCAARLPVYILLAAVFFPAYAGLAVFSMYMLGIVIAIVLGIVFKHTLFKGKEQTPFILELPPYRVPTLRSVWTQMWERTASFIRKAWTIIMAVSIVVWLLIAIPVGGQGSFADTDIDQSAFATVSSVAAPIFAPLGFGSWESSGALVTGIIAKEVVISTMGQIYGLEEAEATGEPTSFIADVGTIATSFVGAVWDTIKSIPLIVGINVFEAEAEDEPTALMGAIRNGFEESSGGHGALAALAFMTFVLLYTPCMVATAAARQEFGSKWMWFSVIGQFVLAWIVAFLVFQGGLLLGLG